MRSGKRMSGNWTEGARKKKEGSEGYERLVVEWNTV